MPSLLCWLQEAARGEGGVGAAWPRGRSGWGTGQQGQAVLSPGSWRKATWGRHIQAAWESVVLAETTLTFLPFWRFQKFNTAKTVVMDLLVGLNSNQLVWICHLLCFLLLLTEKSFIWEIYLVFWFRTNQQMTEKQCSNAEKPQV